MLFVLLQPHITGHNNLAHQGETPRPVLRSTRLWLDAPWPLKSITQYKIYMSYQNLSASLHCKSTKRINTCHLYVQQRKPPLCIKPSPTNTIPDHGKQKIVCRVLSIAGHCPWHKRKIKHTLPKLSSAADHVELWGIIFYAHLIITFHWTLHTTPLVASKMHFSVILAAMISLSIHTVQEKAREILWIIQNRETLKFKLTKTILYPTSGSIPGTYHSSLCAQQIDVLSISHSSIATSVTCKRSI